MTVLPCSDTLEHCDCHGLYENKGMSAVYNFLSRDDSEANINRAFDVLFDKLLSQEFIDNNVQLGVE